MTAEAETQRIAHLTPLDDVLARITTLAAPVAPREVALADAVGRVLASDVFAQRRPSAALALRDGFAVRAELTTDASSYTPAPMPGALHVDAGAPMPPAADAVAPLDIVEMRAGEANIIAPVTVGDGVLPAATDAGPDASLLRAGNRLTPARCAALAAAGIERVTVRVPSLRIVRARPQPDRIIEAAAGFIAHAIRSSGGAVLPDREPATELGHAIQNSAADAIIAIGGTGGGRNDASVRTLARLGRVEVHGIALSPGETAAFGVIGTRPVLLLPGRLDAAIAGWLVIGKHLLARLSASNEQTPTMPATLTRKIASPLGLAEVVPVRVRDGKAEPIASGYVPLSAIAQADGWIFVPAGSEGYPAGKEVMLRPWP
jgi:molybdopterin molybdotransferase